MKYALALTFFNPTIDNIDNLQNYIENFDEIFIYDNSLDNKKYKEFIPNDEKVHYLFDGINDGLPRAFNTVLNSSYIKNCDILCTMDQDSHFGDSEIRKIKSFIEKNNNKEVAIFAPYIIYNNKYKVPQQKVTYEEWVICSGSFVNLDIVRKHKVRYDENYFIDRFEVDFCKQLRLLGYKIVVNTDSMMKQELGTDSGHKHSNHSALRHYYLFRNRLYFNYKYYSKTKAFCLSVLQIIKHTLLIFLFEEHKIEKVKACLYGFVDYRKKKFGPLGGENH